MAKLCACGCGIEFTPKRADGRFASAACRVRWNRAQKKPGGKVVRLVAAGGLRLDPASPPVETKSVADAVRAELGDQINTVLGRSALVIAERLDSRADPSGAAVASLAKQLAVLMASRPIDPTAVEDDPVAKARLAVAKIREQHLAGA